MRSIKKKLSLPIVAIWCFILSVLFSCADKEKTIETTSGTSIVIIGNNLSARMLQYGLFETEMHVRNPKDRLFIRNLSRPGNTPGFRPHSARESPWAFPGADKFYRELSRPTGSQGQFEYPDEWLTRLKADIVIAFFGYNESFAGDSGLAQYRKELSAFIDHTLKQNYNGVKAPRLILVSPTALEVLPEKMNSDQIGFVNENISKYVQAMKDVAQKHEILFLDVYKESIDWQNDNDAYTIDGLQLNQRGYKLLSTFLSDHLFGVRNEPSPHYELVLEAVNEKNWYWDKDFNMPNGIHAFGRRHEPYGSENYPYEITKVQQLTAIRDTAIWKALEGVKLDLAKYDINTIEIPSIESNHSLENSKNDAVYLYEDEALRSMHMAEGYDISLFASEELFPDLANPVQIAFDSEGRLWVAVMPSYPHYKPGDSKPNDKLIILEDTDNDGRADKQITWADGLHMPTGFEITQHGVFVAAGTKLLLLKDSNNDDNADHLEVVLNGFDNHDSHHAISTFESDPSGALYFAEGTFLHSNIETIYGPVRGTNGGFYRYNHSRKKLERTAQIDVPNPWGVAFDGWGQNFYLETSTHAMRWMMPSTIKPYYGIYSPKSRDLTTYHNRVRPTSGIEFIYSDHFPPEIQGDILVCNTIGYRGIKQHQIKDEGTGYAKGYRHDLLWSDDKNFRPVDIEFAPDGSLFLVDWHNILIGHMQHNARDPLRDHAHGRIYRITYHSRPLKKVMNLKNANIEKLLESLKSNQLRDRWRARNELRERNKDKLKDAFKIWLNGLDKADIEYEKYLLETLWLTWGIDQINVDILSILLKSKDYHIRAAAVRAVRYNLRYIDNYKQLLKKSASDPHGRVRLETIVTASWLEKNEGLGILEIISENHIDDWMLDTYLAVKKHLSGDFSTESQELEIPGDIEPEFINSYILGHEIYNKETYCATCHRPDGNGFISSGFPPLAGSEWVQEEEKLIKLTLKGLQGPIEVLGKKYDGYVPMMGFEERLNDKQIAAVLTYIRNSFGNKSSPITAEQVKAVKESINEKKGFFTVEELGN